MFGSALSQSRSRANSHHLGSPARRYRRLPEVRPPRVVERTAADHGVGIDPRDPPTRPSPPRARAADTSVKELRRCSAQRAAEITRAVRPSVTGRAMDYRSGESSAAQDRKSTRLNSSHVKISYAVF